MLVKYFVVGTWFRIAVVPKRVKRLQPGQKWVCQVGKHTYWINDFRFIGTATAENNRPGVNPQARWPDLKSWVAFFGTVRVDRDGYAEFEFSYPTSSCPWE